MVVLIEYMKNYRVLGEKSSWGIFISSYSSIEFEISSPNSHRIHVYDKKPYFEAKFFFVMIIKFLPVRMTCFDSLRIFGMSQRIRIF